MYAHENILHPYSYVINYLIFAVLMCNTDVLHCRPIQTNFQLYGVFLTFINKDTIEKES